MDYDTINYLVAQKAKELTDCNLEELIDPELREMFIELRSYCEFADKLRETI